MQNEVLLFLYRKEISHDFVTEMGCEERRYKMIFEADVFEKLEELAMALQRKELFAPEMRNHVKSFKQ